MMAGTPAEGFLLRKFTHSGPQQLSKRASLTEDGGGELVLARKQYLTGWGGELAAGDGHVKPFPSFWFYENIVESMLTFNVGQSRKVS